MDDNRGGFRGVGGGGEGWQRLRFSSEGLDTLPTQSQLTFLYNNILVA